MKKFKVGDKVITHKFEDVKTCTFVNSMKKFVGVEGVVQQVYDNDSICVHGWTWINSAVTLVSEEKIPLLY